MLIKDCILIVNNFLEFGWAETNRQSLEKYNYVGITSG